LPLLVSLLYTHSLRETFQQARAPAL